MRREFNSHGDAKKLRDRIFTEPKLFEPLGTSRLIHEQSRQRFAAAQGAGHFKSQIVAVEDDQTRPSKR